MSYNDKKPINSKATTTERGNPYKDTSMIYKSLVPTAPSANPEELGFDIYFKGYTPNINKLLVHCEKIIFK